MVASQQAAASRRSKKESNIGRSNSDDDVHKQKLKEQLDQAEATVHRSRNATLQLHIWWRQHLFRLNFMIFALVFYQARQPSAECIKNIKAANQEIATHTPLEAMTMVLNDSVMEIMGLILIGSLAFFLSQPDNTFANKSYMLSTTMIPLQLSAFFQNKTMGCTEVLSLPDTIIVEPLRRPFPISVVFHAIVTVCCWFMQYQMTGRNNDVKAVVMMRKALAEAERQAALSGTTTTTTTPATSNSSSSGSKKKK